MIQIFSGFVEGSFCPGEALVKLLNGQVEMGRETEPVCDEEKQRGKEYHSKYQKINA